MTGVFPRLVLALLLPVLVYATLATGRYGETARLAWRDFLYTIRPQRPPPPNIVIVAVDEPSFQEIGLRWPWPRSTHGKLVDILAKGGARAIGFDMVFVELSPNPEQDAQFARSVKNAGRVVLGGHISQVVRQGYQHSIFVDLLPMLAEATAQKAVVNLYPDPDGIIRQGVLNIEGTPSLAYGVAKTSGLPLSPPPDDSEIFLIDFAGPTGTTTTVSYYQVLEGSLPDGFFKDKLVLVGFASDVAVEIEGAVDAFPSPFFRFSKKMMYGVEIHANSLNTILHGFPLQELDHPLFVLIFLMIAAFPFFVKERPVILAVMAGLSLLGLGGLSAALFQVKGWALDVVPAMGAGLVNAMFWGVREYWITEKEKKKVKGAFESYVPPAVVNEVLRNPDLLRLGGQKKELTVLFSDIRGFTTLSERLDPEQLVHLLNHYLSKMTDKVFERSGTLDKYIGDAIMAFFGAPLPRDDHAVLACRTALDMLEALETMGPEWAKMGLPAPKIGIGINTGAMVVGNMGSDRRFDYTVMGDEVNLSSRLEGITKTYKTACVISENTQKQLGPEFICRELDLVRVKGKKEPVRIFELVATGEVEEPVAKKLHVFSEGIQAYRNQDWDNAEKAFLAVLEQNPADGPSHVFLERCKVFRTSPPDPDWQGVWVMATK